MQLIELDIEVYEKQASFVDAHTIKLVDQDGKGEEIVTSEFILVAVGGRPTMVKVPGAEHCISSDDLFWRTKSPGKTLVVGASYVALECAGFLTAIGCKTSVLVRSILLRGFDQDMANKIGEYMEKKGTGFIRGGVLKSIVK